MIREKKLSALIELAIKQGLGYQELINGLNDSILLAYFQTYPNASHQAEIAIDALGGKVRIMAGGKEITPADFDELSYTIAEKYVAKRLKATGPTPTQSRPIENKNWMPTVFFWAYNTLFVVILIILGFSLFNATYREEVWAMIRSLDWFKRILALLAIGLPIISTTLGIRRKIELGKWFFGCEVPTLLVLLTALCVANNPIPPVMFMIWVLLSIPLTFYLQLSKKTEETKSNKIQMFALVLHQTIFLVMFYLAILWSFIVPLIIGEPLRSILSGGLFDLYRNSLATIMVQLFVLLLFALPALVVLFLPYLITFLFGKSWYETFVVAGRSFGQTKTTKIAIGFSVALVIFVAGLSYQPNTNKYINLLQKATEASSFEERETIVKEILPQEKKIKQAVNDLNTAGRRYPLGKESSFLADGYTQVFDANETVASLINESFKAIAYPFVYQGESDTYGKAAQNYEYIFGSNVWETTSYNYLPYEAKAVTLVSHKIKARTDYEGLVADVSIEDEFANTSFRSEEVVYEFSLPEGAAIHELKLGPELEFDGVIAPKGAAAKTYQREVDRGRDPALLEQTGPRQYRLRVFPIPSTSDYVTLKGKNQKVKFSYTVAADSEGYALPVYSKISNLQVSEKMTIPATLDTENLSLKWKDVSIRPNNLNALRTKLCRANNQFSLKSNSNTPVVLATYQAGFSCGKDNMPEVSELAKGLKVALLYDVSYENKDNPRLKEIKNEIKSNPEIFKKNRFDFYRFNDILSRPIDLTEKNIDAVVYFGKGDVVKALNNLGGKYDAVVVVAGDRLINTSEETAPRLDYPVYILSKDDKIPSYRQILTNVVLQSGGGIVNNFDEVLNKTALLANNSGILFAGPYWSIQNGGQILDGMQTDKNDILSYMVAKSYIDQAIAQRLNATSDNNYLDLVNAFAVKNHVLSPYSSLIALVNDQQTQNLEANSTAEDRYEEKGSSILPPAGGGVNIFNLSIPSNTRTGGGTTIDLSPRGNFASLSSVTPMGMIGGPVSTIAILLLGGLVAGAMAYFIPMLRRKH